MNSAAKAFDYKGKINRVINKCKEICGARRERREKLLQSSDCVHAAVTRCDAKTEGRL